MQPTINLGVVGAVAAGKSTLVRALTGVATQKHSDELIRNITIKLGYANMKIWRCPACPKPQCYQTTDGVPTLRVCMHCNAVTALVKYVSFVDVPGHDLLMATMLNGAAVMDAAIMIVAADLPCPQAQTEEHLIAAETLGLKHFLVAQTKLDLVDDDRARKSVEEITTFVKDTLAEGSHVVPISAQFGVNIDYIAMYLAECVPDPVIDPSAPFHMQIVRSFDVNLPGTLPANVVGGVIGGSVTSGVVNVGDTVEIRPGLVRSQGDTSTYTPIITTITRIESGTVGIPFARQGGLVSFETTLDPCLTRSDRMIGCIVGKVGQMPPVYIELTAECQFLKHSVDGTKVAKFSVGDAVMLHIAARQISAKISAVDKRVLTFSMAQPACLYPDMRISVSRKSSNKWRLVGWGKYVSGKEAMRKN